ncbi:MAG: hypothetical protein U1F08_12050 [Steroidobacteraceae bacterium]
MASPDSRADDSAHLTTAQLAGAAATSSRRTADTPPAAIDDRVYQPGRYPAPGQKVVNGTVTEAPFSPSPALDERNVTCIEGYEEFKGDFGLAVNALSSANIGLREIDTARQKAAKNQAFTEASRLILVSQFAAKTRDQWHGAIDKAQQYYVKLADSIDESLSTPLEASAVGPLAAEIRAHVKGLSDEQRGKFIAEAMQARDVKTLQSILGAPGYLSGLAPTMTQHFTRLYREATAPEAARKLALIRKVIGVLERAGPIAYAQAEKAMGGTFQDAFRYKNANDDAMKALDFRARGLG